MHCEGAGSRGFHNCKSSYECLIGEASREGLSGGWAMELTGIS